MNTYCHDLKIKLILFHTTFYGKKTYNTFIIFYQDYYLKIIFILHYQYLLYNFILFFVFIRVAGLQLQNLSHYTSIYN